MAIGKNLKRILTQEDITVQELARKSGVSANTIYGIIKRDNETVKPEILKNIVNTLNISTRDLLDIDSNNLKRNIRLDYYLPDDINDQCELFLKLADYFSQLNNKGKEKIIENIEILIKVPDFTNE